MATARVPRRGPRPDPRQPPRRRAATRSAAVAHSVVLPIPAGPLTTTSWLAPFARRLHGVEDHRELALACHEGVPVGVPEHHLRP